MEETDLLDEFLAIADELVSDTKTNKEESESVTVKKNKTTKDNEDEFFLESIDEFCKNLEPSTSGIKKNNEGVNKKRLSLIHNGDTDSSDDESNRDYQNSKYNEYGREIKHLLTSQLPGSSFEKGSAWKPKRPVATQQNNSPFQKKEEVNVITDPFFGIRISNPLISSVVLKQRMADRRAVTMAQLKEFVKRENNQQDWVIAGVIIGKSPVKTSQKGNQYLIWTLSDLKNDLKTCAMFLFGSAYKQLWKTAAGTVLGVLNPSIMESREGSKDEAALSVDNAQKVMIFGHSKDFGMCKSKKKDGSQCTAFVNKNHSEFCVYHIKSEYQKLSRRSELQANFVGGGLTALRNKVLGKNEVFYAGKSYMAIPSKKNQKHVQKDNDRLKSLSSQQKKGILTTSTAAPSKIKVAATFDVSKAQRIKDLQLLKKLQGEKNFQEKLDKGLEINTEATVKKEILQNNIQKLKKKLLNNGEQSNLEEFDFLNDDPVKLAEEVLKDLNNLNSPKGPKRIPKSPDSNRNLLDDPLTTPKSKKTLNDLDKLEAEMFDMFNSPKNQFKTTKNHCGTPDLDQKKNAHLKTSTSLPESNVQLKTPTSSKKDDQRTQFKNGTSKHEYGESSSSTSQVNLSTPTSSQKSHELNRRDENKIPKSGTRTSLFAEKSGSAQKSNLRDTTNLPTHNGVKDSNPASGSILKNSNLDTPEINDLATKSKFFSSKLGAPKLASFDSKIDLSTITIEKNSSLHMNKAKLSALKFVQSHGPLKKEEEKEKPKKGVKRFLETTDEFKEEKRQKLADENFTSERFKKIMAMQSKHTDLLDAADLEREEKYFRKLEVKEKMEEKMATIFKVDCKAVKCLTCKYEAFSASDKCKQERHVLKVIDAVKRFFKCAKCGYRTVTLKIIPLVSCSNCGSSKWDRTTMMKEKIVQVGEKLSIRGMEEKNIGHANTGGNINLLVPDE